MDQGEVTAFVERARSVLADAPSMGKRNTELRIVEPFLGLLGWDVRSSAVEAAYVASDGSTVDYALCPDDEPGAFVTVTASREDLQSPKREELVAAMRASNVPRGLYTNGREFLLLALDDRANATDTDGESDLEALRLDLTTLPENVDALRALGYEPVAAVGGASQRRAAAALVEADETAVTRVTNAVVDVTGEDVAEDIEPLARQFLDAVVSTLAPTGVRSGNDDDSPGDADEPTLADAAGEPVPSEAASVGAVDIDASNDEDVSDGDGQSRETIGTDLTGRENESHGGAADASGESSRAQSREANAGGANVVRTSNAEFVVRYFEGGHSIAAVGNPDVDNAMAQAVEYLLRERGLGKRLNYPYVPGDKGIALLNREAVHPDGRELQPRIDLGGLYLYTGQDVDAKREYLETLAERAGLRVMFSGDWP